MNAWGWILVGFLTGAAIPLPAVFLDWRSPDGLQRRILAAFSLGCGLAVAALEALVCVSVNALSVSLGLPLMLLALAGSVSLGSRIVRQVSSTALDAHERTRRG